MTEINITSDSVNTVKLPANLAKATLHAPTQEIDLSHNHSLINLTLNSPSTSHTNSGPELMRRHSAGLERLVFIDDQIHADLDLSKLDALCKVVFENTPTATCVNNPIEY